MILSIPVPSEETIAALQQKYKEEFDVELTHEEAEELLKLTIRYFGYGLIEEFRLQEEKTPED